MVGSSLGSTDGSQGQPLEQDSITLSIVELGHPHDDIHEGFKYIASDLVTGLGAGATQLYLLITPSTVPKIHMLFDIISTPGLDITIFEGPAVTVNGTPVAAINQNRGSNNTAALSVFKTPTVTANGTQLQIQEIGSGNASGKFGGNTSVDRNESEYLLKPNTAYLIKEVTLSNSTAITTTFHWYER